MYLKTRRIMFLSIFIFFTQLINAYPWPIPDTGQTKCYDLEKEIPCPTLGEPFYGQDGNYSINPKSYSKLDEKGNGLPDNATSWVMVRDNVTGLIWEVKTAKDNIKNYSDLHDADNQYTWYDSNPMTNMGNPGLSGNGTDTEDFIHSLNHSNLSEFSDWRIPSVYELASIAHLDNSYPAVNKNYFPHTISKFYWSKTIEISNNKTMWGAGYTSGYVNSYAKTSSVYIRAVRYEHINIKFEFINNNDGTIFDKNTGLMWQQESIHDKTWGEALQYCEGLNFAQYTDWRLPNKEELRSIVDYNEYNPSINTSQFPDTISGFYWSSSTRVYEKFKGWGIMFDYGFDYHFKKTGRYNVRAVRGGQPLISDNFFIISPKQTSVWVYDKIMPIRWDTKDISGNVSISISFYGGKKDSFEMIAESTPNDGEFDWIVTNTGVEHKQCMIKIIPLSCPEKGTQQGLFVIVGYDDIPENVTLRKVSWMPPENSNNVSGYYYILNNNKNFTINSDIVEQCKSTSSLSAFVDIPPGSDDIKYYFHVASVDDQNRIGPTSSICIWIDNVPPQNCSVLTNILSSNQSIELTLVADGASDMYISNTGFGINGQWEPFSSHKVWQSILNKGLQSIYIQFKDQAGNICQTSTIVSFDNKPPEPPENITFEPEIGECTSNSLTITWYETNNKKHVAGYSVLLDTNPDSIPDNIVDQTSLLFQYDQLQPETYYYFHISTVDVIGNISTPLHIGYFCTVNKLHTPQGLQILNVTANSIDLKWFLMGENIYYNVYRSNEKDGFYIKCDPFQLSRPEFTDTNVTDGMTYWYRISASNSQGEESLLSEPVSAKYVSSETGFELLPFQTHQMQIAGLTALFPIQILPIGNYKDNVQLWVANLHPSINAKFNKQKVAPPGNVTLELNIPDTVQAGNYAFQVTAMGGNYIQVEQPLSIDIVNPASDDESAISAYIKTNPVGMSTPVQIYGSIQPSRVNTPLFVYIQHENSDSPIVKETMTNNTSGYQLNFIPDQTGSYHIFSKWDGDHIFKANESAKIELTVLRGQAMLTCTTPNTDTSLDSTVIVTGQLSPIIPNEVIILQKIDPNGVSTILNNRIFINESGNYQYSVKLDIPGIWENSTCWKGNDQYQGVVSSPLRLYPGIEAGKTLIVAGGGKAANPLWETTSYLTTRFYRILLNRQCTPDIIHYISPDKNFEDDQIIINDTTPQVSDIETYIHSLYLDKSEPDVNQDKPLLIYMADHGGNGTFKVNHGFEILKAKDLDNWLDDLQTQTFCPVYIIIEACYSGTFTELLFPDTSQKRVIITSTGHYVARYESNGRKSFSQYLFNELSQGYSLKHSFYEATKSMHPEYIFNGQIPQLEDGKGGDIAQNSYIGGSFLIGDLMPEIVTHTPNQTISAGTFDLYADISDVEGISRVWASIMPPNYHLPETTKDFETPIIKLPTIDLQGNGHYTGSYSEFIINGMYRVTLYCEDSSGNVISKEILLNVINGKTIIPGDLDGNGHVNIIDAIVSLQKLSGMSVFVDESARILCGMSVGACEVIHILQLVAGK